MVRCLVGQQTHFISIAQAGMPCRRRSMCSMHCQRALCLSTSVLLDMELHAISQAGALADTTISATMHVSLCRAWESLSSSARIRSLLVIYQ